MLQVDGNESIDGEEEAGPSSRTRGSDRNPDARERKTKVVKSGAARDSKKDTAPRSNLCGRTEERGESDPVSAHSMRLRRKVSN